jgi:hypothetical protein
LFTDITIHCFPQTKLFARTKKLKNMKRVFTFATASACLLSVVSAQASLNFVQDPGFEGGETGLLTSSSSPWYNPAYTPGSTDIDNVAVNSSNPHNGSFNAVLTEETIDSSAESAVLNQSISLTAGAHYAVSFWIASADSGDLTVSLNGTLVTPGVNGVMAVTGGAAYTQYTFNAVPANASGILSFVWSSSTLPAALDLDDVSVTAAPVPEPTTMVAGALMLLPFAASTFRLRKKQSAE